MKIRVTEYTTEIEADARELRESNTLGDNLALMLSRCFRSSEPFEDEEEEKGGAFYEGDDDDPLTKIGLFVNAWMPLPEKYHDPL